MKIGRVGGYSEALPIHELCLERGVPLWCGGMFESGIGRAHNVALASLPGFTLPGDISASSRYFERDVIVPPVEVAKDGTVAVPTSPGLGFDVDVDFLESRTELGGAAAKVSRFSTQGLLADLEALVIRESPSDDAPAVSALAHYIVERLRAVHVHAEARPCPPRGDAVLATVGEGGGRPAAARPPRHGLAQGHARGDALPRRGRPRARAGRLRHEGGHRPGHGGARGPGPAREASTGHAPAHPRRGGGHRGLAAPAARGGAGECARCSCSSRRSQGAAKVARKGTGTFTVRFGGRAAHAGLDPEKGASALLELAHFTLFAAALTRPDTGTTVTPTVAQGGARTNVVPESAWLGVDCRVWSKAEAERVESALRAYEPRDPRVSVAFEGGFDRPPLEPTPAAQALYERAKAIAAELGFALPAARVGGASDGNLTAAAGVPTLDGLGPVGDGAHARHEWVLASDLPRRAELLVRLLDGGA